MGQIGDAFIWSRRFLVGAKRFQPGTKLLCESVFAYRRAGRVHPLHDTDLL
ncbi:hypothetical protein [Pseudoramibacter alactolyticus]